MPSGNNSSRRRASKGSWMSTTEGGCIRTFFFFFIPILFSRFLQCHTDIFFFCCHLSSGQDVLLTTTEPHTLVRILSITPDHGLLRCIPISDKPKTSTGLTPLYNRDVDAGEDDRGSWFPSVSRPGGAARAQTHNQSPFVDLQPDGNSFDLMSGLIKRKV